MSDIEQEEERWSSQEISAAMTHLYYMRGLDFDATNLPRKALAKMLGVDRTTVWRAIEASKAAIDLAVVIQKRLGQIAKEEQALARERAARKVITRAARNRRYREKKRLEKERLLNDPGYQGTRNSKRDPNLRALQQKAQRDRRDGAGLY